MKLLMDRVEILPIVSSQGTLHRIVIRTRSFWARCDSVYHLPLCLRRKTGHSRFSRARSAILSIVHSHAMADVDTAVHQNLGHVVLHVQMHHVRREKNYEPRVLCRIVRSFENLNSYDKSVNIP